MDYAITDDFLSPHEHLDLWHAFQDAVGPAGDTSQWNRVYSLTRDGDRAGVRDTTPSAAPGPDALRIFSEKLSALVSGDRAPPSLPRWTDFTASPWVYRAGDGLEWHADTGRVAAYIYYVHPAWRATWGGELLVADQDAPDTKPDAAEAVCRTGGAFIYPRPNRLVLLRGGVLHCVKKVERAVGQNFRASVSGFFFSTDTVPGPV